MEILEKKFVLEYIQDMLMTYKLGAAPKIENAKYHHNASYADAPSIIRHGILPLKDIVQLGLKKYPESYLEVADDITSHVNGKIAVSLAVMGLDDLYPDENEYFPDKPHMVDFRVDSNIKTGRSSIHYGNEYLSYQSISPDKIRSIDIRLLQLIKGNKSIEQIEFIIGKYNNLIKVTDAMLKANLGIPLREKTIDCSIDYEGFSRTPQIALKK